MFWLISIKLEFILIYKLKDLICLWIAKDLKLIRQKKSFAQ